MPVFLFYSAQTAHFWSIEDLNGKLLTRKWDPSSLHLASVFVRTPSSTGE